MNAIYNKNDHFGLLFELGSVFFDLVIELEDFFSVEDCPMLDVRF